MKKRFLIIGSGKMARNIGYYFLRQGNQVCWITNNIEYLKSLNNWFQKMKRRLKGLTPELDRPTSNIFYLPDNPDLPDFDIIIETSRENTDEKRMILKKLEHLYTNQTILVSNSSSILPRTIHPHCMGLHFFYPLELIDIVELIVPSSHSPHLVSELIKILKYNQLNCFKQTERSAFLMNRLLLPIQSEAFRDLMSGYNPELIDQSTVSHLLPMGQLRLMDSIGLDILFLSINNFINRMGQNQKDQYAGLLKGLKTLLSMGKKGNKNGDGLLMGSNLPWKFKSPTTDKINDLSKKTLYLFINTCYYAVEKNDVSPEDLEVIHGAIFSPEIPLYQAVNKIKPKTICKNLEKWYKKTEIQYFSPAALLDRK